MVWVITADVGAGKYVDDNPFLLIIPILLSERPRAHDPLHSQPCTRATHDPHKQSKPINPDLARDVRSLHK